MDLKDIIAIRGKGELFRVLSKTPKGIIVETLNENHTRMKVQPNLQVLILADITIYSNDNSDLYLGDVFKAFYLKEGLKLSLDHKSDPEAIKAFMKETVPNHDEEKVYMSDMKKMLRWYNNIASFYPDILENLSKEPEPSEEVEETETTESESKEEK